MRRRRCVLELLDQMNLGSIGMRSANESALETAQSFQCGLLSNFLHSQKSPHSGMLSYSIVFLLLSLISAFFGFGKEVGSAELVAKLLFFVFLTAAIVTTVIGKGSQHKSSGRGRRGIGGS